MWGWIVWQKSMRGHSIGISKPYISWKGISLNVTSVLGHEGHIESQTRGPCQTQVHAIDGWICMGLKISSPWKYRFSEFNLCYVWLIHNKNVCVWVLHQWLSGSIVWWLYIYHVCPVVGGRHTQMWSHVTFQWSLGSCGPNRVIIKDIERKNPAGKRHLGAPPPCYLVQYGRVCGGCLDDRYSTIVLQILDLKFRPSDLNPKVVSVWCESQWGGSLNDLSRWLDH